MKSQWIAGLEGRAKAFRPPAGRLGTTAAHPRPEAGQVWSTHASPPFPDSAPLPCSEDPFLVVLLQPDVAALNGHMLNLVAPLFRDTHLAGPTDVLLPKEVFGHREAVAIGAAVTALRDSLAHCVGALPNPWPARLTAFFRSIETGGDPPAEVRTGLEYLDDADIRFKFQEQMTEGLGYLQAPALAWAEECGVLPEQVEKEPKVLSLLENLAAFLFPPFEFHEAAPTRLAAADAKGTRPLQSHVYASEDCTLSLQISEAEKPGYCAVEVLDDPHGRLEGCQILNEAGKVLGTIERRTAFFPCRTDEGRRIAFQLQDETLILLRRIDTHNA